MVTRKMRVLAASLALVLCVSLYSVPRAKAVATEVAVGTAAVASYFQATGLTMAASAGATGALVTTGVADIAGSYAMATGAASSGSAFLSSLAAGVSISPAGAIVLTAAAVVAIGALVAWYVGENGLTESGSSVPAYVSSPNGFTVINHGGQSMQYDFSEIVYTSGQPYILPATTNDQLKSFVSEYASFMLQDDSSYQRYFTFQIVNDKFTFDSIIWRDVPANKQIYKVSILYSQYVIRDTQNSRWIFTDATMDSSGFYRLSDTYYFSFSGYPWLDEFFDISESKLTVTRQPEFSQPDTELESESQKQMVIDLGLSPGTTLDAAVEEVPNLIAAGTLAPTYEITTTETGEGTDTETDPEEESGIYIPVLSDIKTALVGLADSITDGIMSGLQSLFVPDEAFFAEAVPALQETFQGRMGLLTFPISLLADFLGRLLNLSDQEPILRWNSVSIYGTELIAAGQYNLNDALKSAPVKQMHDIYMIAVNAILIFAFLGLCHNKYRKIMQN